MKQIKTIAKRVDDAENFDEKVNEALKKGYKLKKRYIFEGPENSTTVFHPLFVAEMEKEEN